MARLPALPRREWYQRPPLPQPRPAPGRRSAAPGQRAPRHSGGPRHGTGPPADPPVGRAEPDRHRRRRGQCGGRPDPARLRRPGHGSLHGRLGTPEDHRAPGLRPARRRPPRRPAAGHRPHPRGSCAAHRFPGLLHRPPGDGPRLPEGLRAERQAGLGLPPTGGVRPPGRLLRPVLRPSAFLQRRRPCRPRLPGRADRPGHGPRPALRRQARSGPRPAAGPSAEDAAAHPRPHGRRPVSAECPRHGHRR